MSNQIEDMYYEIDFGLRIIRANNYRVYSLMNDYIFVNEPYII